MSTALPAPLPLTAPDGRVVAYACPVCFRAGDAATDGDLRRFGEDE